jgi:hypothetical protein
MKCFDCGKSLLPDEFELCSICSGRRRLEERDPMYEEVKQWEREVLQE